ncbi:MAG: glycoside hydrolase family 31 protein [Coprothermobacterota bacterium]|nr:glycoside hydrolase family 31 protein [Coprothermobacterota bacterium]
MRIKNLRDFFYMVRFGLLTVSFPALFQGLWAGMTAPILEAFYRNPRGGYSESRVPPSKALRNLFSPERKPQPTTIGRVLSFREEGGRVILSLERGFLEARFLASDLLRIRASFKEFEEEPFSFAVIKRDWPPVSCQLKEEGNFLQFSSSDLVLNIEKESGLLSLHLKEGGNIFEEERPLQFEGETATVFHKLEGETQFYGLGEKASSLNHRGKRFRLWNSDPVTYDCGSDPLYSSIPFFLIKKSGKFSGIFLDNPSSTFFDFGSASPNFYSFGSKKGELVYYVFSGPSWERVLFLYSELTGHAPLPPLWALGYHQSRWSYSSQHEVEEIASQFRKRKIPCDVIHLDIDYMEGWRSFTWSRKRFPEPEKMAARLKEMGFKLVPNVDCGIKADKKYWVFRDGMEKDVFLKLPGGKLYRGPVWPGYASFPDFSENRVREWWRDLNATLTEVGMAGVENDMDEPSVFGRGTVPNFLIHRNEGKSLFHEECHNAYGLLTAKASWEAWKNLRPNERPFVLTRSTYAGGQRYGATWTADNQSTWEHLWLSIPMCLKLALSGFSFVGVDVGGFARNATGELLARWMQLGAFLPFFRNHCAKAMVRQEPWAFGQPYEDACRKAIELRYELLPYIYTAFFLHHQKGLPVIRPFILDWPEREEFFKEDHEFLLGEWLLFFPVLEEKARIREIQFPPGKFYDYFTGKAFGEGIYRLEVDLFSIPLFVKEGAVIPTWPSSQFVGEKPIEEVILRVYPGSGESLLYEDDGISFDYQRGFFRLTRIKEEYNSGRLSLRFEEEGDFRHVPPQFRFLLFGLERAPSKVKAEGKEVPFFLKDGVLEIKTPRIKELEIEF